MNKMSLRFSLLGDGEFRFHVVLLVWERNELLFDLRWSENVLDF